MERSTIEDLVGAARAVQGEFSLRIPEFTAASVAAAIRSSSGAIYTGVSVHLACGIGFCAEHAAIAEMLKHREVEIATIVAVNDSDILAPCGRCRELMLQLSSHNADAQVVLPGRRLTRLADLLPAHWLPASDSRS